MSYSNLEKVIAQSPDPHRPKRSIKPRKPSKAAFRPLIIVDHFEAYIERTGELIPRSDLANRFITEPASIVVCHNPGKLVRELHNELKSHPRWQFKVTPIEREVIPVRNGKAIVTSDSVVAFFGLSRENGHSESQYHYPIDPTLYCRSSASKLYPEEPNQIAALLRFGKEVRKFLQDYELHPRPTSGGLAGQLLRDSRFYSEDRRKVPRDTNERAREHLPGNFYRVYQESQEHRSAVYFDQKGSHHRIASEITLPHSDGLYARGFFNHESNDIWAKNGTSRYYRETKKRYGLLKVWLDVPLGASKNFAPPYMEEGGHKVAYIFTNEIPLIEALGGYIEGIIAAWTSDKVDYGIWKYAEWAQEELAHSEGGTRTWKKSVLLSAYGVLASKPRNPKFGFANAKSGNKTDIPIGGMPVEVYLKEAPKLAGDTLANVIQRGMIEAETRKRSLEFARWLRDNSSATVLMVYADSVIATIEQIPFLPDGWRVESELTNLFIMNPVSFTSEEITKLPGIPYLNEREQLARIESMKQRAKWKMENSSSEKHQCFSSENAGILRKVGPGLVMYIGPGSPDGRCYVV